MPEEKKNCSKCKLEKPLTEFSFWSKIKNKRRPDCKQCEKDHRIKTGKVNPKQNVSLPPGKKLCSWCNIIKDIDKFYFWSKNKNRRRPECKDCSKKYNQVNHIKIKNTKKKFRIKHKEKLLITEKSYREKNREKVNISSKRSKEKHKEKIRQKRKIYYLINREKIRERNRNYNKKRRAKIRKYEKDLKKNNPSFRVRKNISSRIAHILKSGKGKNSSFLKYVSYTMDELKKWLESLWEPWMNWNNYGQYNPSTWDDNDPSTWTWQIDHIIPHSEFKYTSMEDEEFKKCWALENLRPLSAKQNILDGTSKVRHIREYI